MSHQVSTIHTMKHSVGGTRQMERWQLFLDCCYHIAKNMRGEARAEFWLEKAPMDYFVYTVRRKKREIMIFIHSLCVAEQHRPLFFHRAETATPAMWDRYLLAVPEAGEPAHGKTSPNKLSRAGLYGAHMTEHMYTQGHE